MEMGKTILYVIIGVVVSTIYFTLVNHYMMDMQGLDYWYLFRG